MYVRTSNPANASNANPGWPPAGSSGADTNARAGNDEPIRSAPRQRARHPTLSALIELKPELPPVVSPFVANLEAFDQRHDASLTNAQVITPFARMNPDAEVQVAMRRKASFCLIREVLQDINKLTDVDKSACYGSRADPLVRHMLTAQVDALQKQVTSNRTDAYNKIMQGKRLCPLFMQTPAFHHFMQSETNALRNIVSLCGRSGPRRNIDISDALSEFAQRYLAVTNRKPAHLKPNQSVTYFNAATFTNCSVGVWLFDPSASKNTSQGTIYREEYGEKFAAIFIDCATANHPYADPAQGTDFDRFATSGFERCSIPQKQAIDFLLALFYEMADLETRIAVDRGKTSFNPVEGSLAYETDQELNFKGVVAFGDRFHEHRGQPDDQRSQIVDTAAGLRSLAIAYREANGQPLLSDPELEKWLTGPRFSLDMEAVRNPEFRMWMMGVDFAKQELLNSQAFMPGQHHWF